MVCGCSQKRHEEFGIDAGTTEKIQDDQHLGEEPVPEVQREVLVGAAEAGNEVVLKGADGRFSGIAAVDVRWN